MPENYCFNCRHWSVLPDRVYCGWCLQFFGYHGRLPRAGERNLTAVERLFAEMG